MRYAPLTLTTLASLIPPDIPAEVALIDEGVDEIDPGAVDADLVGITVGLVPATTRRRRAGPIETTPSTEDYRMRTLRPLETLVQDLPSP